MLIGVLVLCRGHLKSLGAVISEALARSHDVVIVTDPSIQGERKPGESIYPEEILMVWPDVRVEARRMSEEEVDVPLDAFVGPDVVENGPSLCGMIRYLLMRGIRVYSVSDLYETAGLDPELLDELSCTFYVSEHQRALHERLYPTRFESLSSEAQERTAVVGATWNAQSLADDRAEARQRFALPPEGKVVMLMSLKMRVPDPFRRIVWGEGGRLRRTASALVRLQPSLIQHVWRDPHYRDVCESIASFCEREGATLIVKTRPKNGDPPWLADLADVYIREDAVEYPYTSMRLVSVTDLCVHFGSSVALATAQIGVPCLSVDVPHTHLETKKMLAFTREFRTGVVGSLFNSPGIVDSVDYRDLASLLDRQSLADLRPDDAARHEYVRKYLGFDDFDAPRRILDRLEEDHR